jgi:hypothetical protein
MVAWRNRKHAGRHGGDPAARVDDPPTAPSAVVAPESFAVSSSASPSEVSEVADVIGATAVPQIVVGSPSPSMEPSAIGAAYRSFPFRPDVVIDGWSTEAITVRGVSQRGHLHRYNGAPRQDDFAVHELPDGRVIVLVADGVSQAPQSHFGASTAIRTAAEWLASNLGDDLVDTDWLALLKNAAWALNERAQTLLGLDEPDPVRAEELLATTLVCAVIEPAGAGALRAYLVGVGDSVAWLLSSGNFVEILAGKTVPASGIASSAVVGLPRVPTEVKPVAVDIASSDVLLIATDGIGDPLGSGHGGVGNLFREVLTGPSTPSLIEFAHAVDFSREAFDDDRSLVAVWPRKQGSVTSETGRHSRGFSPPEGLWGG